MKTAKELFAEGTKMLNEAKGLQMKKDFSAEDVDQRNSLLKEGMRLRTESAKLRDMEKALAEVYAPPDGKSTERTMQNFRGLGHYLVENYKYYKPRAKNIHPYFTDSEPFTDPAEKDTKERVWVAQKSHRKDLVESVGASGGFLVPPEFREELLAIAYETNPIRQRATIIPMRRRQVVIPTLDQTGTTGGQTRMHGGIVATWTEEATEKDETQPAFRQIALVAHKLVCYTEASDELLDDEAVGLVAVLSGPMGWGGAIEWEEEYTFLRGTGAGQPDGVIDHAATVRVPRLGAGAVAIGDLFDMLAAHHGERPIWHINRGLIPQILGLNGPAGNPSYVFIDNAREGMPMNLFGFPIHWTEKLPVLGTRGDVLLADWRYYLVGDRQMTTIDSSQHYRFRYDLTAWRAVHRVDGQPWLSTVITLADGTTTISPFVVLDSEIVT